MQVCNDSLRKLVKSLSYYSKRGSVEKVRSMLHDARRDGVEPNLICQTALLEAVVRCNSSSSSDVIATFREIERECGADLVLYNNMLYYFSMQGDVASCTSWFEKLQCANFTPDVRSFNCMINGCAKASDAQLAVLYIQRMNDSNVIPNIYSFNGLLEAYARCSDAACTSRLLLRQIKNRNIHFGRSIITPDVISYSSFIGAWGRRGCPEIAIRVLKIMDRNSITPNEVVVSNLLKGFVDKHGAGLTRERVLRGVMYKYKLPLNLVCVNCVIDALCKDGEMDRAILWFKKLEEVRLRPDCFTFGAIIHGYAAMGDRVSARSWMERLHNEKIKVDRTIFNARLMSLIR